MSTQERPIQLTQVLDRVIADRSFSASILLYGNKGVGKKSLVDSIVKQLLCSNEAACDECVSCKQVVLLSHPEVHLVTRREQAQSIAIEDIRELVRFLHLQRSSNSLSRIGVVHEAQYLFSSAANALLKTLEEPPTGVLLFMVADTPHALPQTVRSRCIEVYVPGSTSHSGILKNTAIDFLSAPQHRRFTVIDDLIKERSSSTANLKSFEISESISGFIDALEGVARDELISRANNTTSDERFRSLSDAKLLSAVGWIQDLRYTIRMNTGAQTALEQFSLRLS